MNYKVLVKFDKIELPLFEVDIPKGEARNLADALLCEINYNGFDMEIL